MKHNKAWKCAAQMPPLIHKFDGEEFDIAKSQDTFSRTWTE